MRQLFQARDAYGQPILGCVNPSDTINGMHFTGSGAKTDNVPAGANYVLVSGSQNVDLYVKIGGVAASYSGDKTDGSASEINPSIRQLDGATAVGVAVVLTSGNCDVSLSYWS
jgi:hypothetical protein